MMRSKVNLHFAIFFMFGLAITGCLSPVTELYPEDEELRPLPVYILSHGWHVGIAIESKYIRHKFPEHEKMPEARYLKFGWGDHRYYPHDDPGIGLLLRAALLPTRGGAWQPLASEGGHASFAPHDKVDLKILKRLWARFGHVSYELRSPLTSSSPRSGGGRTSSSRMPSGSGRSSRADSPSSSTSARTT
jgi:hypothetical protein